MQLSESNGLVLLGVGNALRFISFGSADLLAQLDGAHGTYGSISPDGKRLLTENGLLWPVSRRNESREIIIGPPSVFSDRNVSWARFSADATLISFLHDFQQFKIKKVPAVTEVLSCDFPQTSRFAVSPTLKWAASYLRHGRKTDLFEITDHGLVERTTAELPPGHSFFSPDGNWLAIGEPNGYSLWHTKNWQQVKSVKWDMRNVPGLVSFASDAGIICIRKYRHIVQLMSFPEMEPLATIAEGEHPNEECHFIISSDARRLAIFWPSGELTIYDIEAMWHRLAELNLEWQEPAFPKKITTPIEPPEKLTFVGME